MTPIEIDRCIALWKEGHAERAIAILRDGLLSEPDSPAEYYHLGVMLAARHDYDEAIACLKSAVQLDPEQPDFANALALTYAAAGRRAESLSTSERAHRQNPADVRTSLLLALAAQEAASAGESSTIEVRPHAAAMGPSAPLDRLDDLAEVCGRRPESVEQFLDLPESPIDKEVFSILARTLRRRLEHKPDSSNHHVLSGRILERLRMISEAAEAYRTALSINGKNLAAEKALAHLAA